MPRPKAKKIIVQFDDGTQKEAAYEDLTAQAQCELSRQPVLFDFTPDGEGKKFVLLEWKDGWKEVKVVDETCTEINRYYVITRPEDVGRLSLNTEGGYPELLEIGRTPLDLKQIGFVENHQIGPKKSDREGKKVDHFFTLKTHGDLFSRNMENFREALREEGIDIKTLSSEVSSQGRDLYSRIARRMGVRAFERQQDVLDYMDYLAQDVARKS
ncbi:MAG: hypothetical protein K9N10_03030 [Deltaproteobacteria bacterium]|nr:hypothetical protein [Deltaproteobacteria bacterium]